jgi:hypothetical protein
VLVPVEVPVDVAPVDVVSVGLVVVDIGSLATSAIISIV